MLKRTEKVAIVDQLTKELKEFDGYALISFQGLTVSATEEMKAALREIGANAKVYKNRLLKMALKNNSVVGLDPYLTKSTMLIYSPTDIVAALKVVVNFAKKNEPIGLKGGVVSGDVYGDTQIVEISKLPGQKELIGMIAGGMNAVISKFVGVLNGIMTKFVGTIEAVEKKQS